MKPSIIALAFAMLAMASVAAASGGPFPHDYKSCNEFFDYFQSDAARIKLNKAIMELAKKNDPKATFFDPAGCTNAKIKPVDAKTADVEAIYSVTCRTEDPRIFLCSTDDNVSPLPTTRPGDRYFKIVVRASCKGVSQGPASCIDIKSLEAVGPRESPKIKPGRWYPFADNLVPKAINDVAFKKAINDAAVTKLAKANTKPGPYAEYSRLGSLNYNLIKFGQNGALVSYRVPVTVVTQSLTKGCRFPVIREVAYVEVSAAGKVLSITDGEFSRAEHPDSGRDPKCVGSKPWKEAVAKIAKFCKGVKGGCSRHDIADRR